MMVLGLLVAVAALGFMTLGARGAWDYVLPFRGVKLAALVLVAFAIAVSTVLFQTVTDNRILTPSIMGFDALYVLLQTTVVFTVGSARMVGIDPRLRFTVEVLLMVGFAGLLFRWLFAGARRSLHLLLLVGIVLGVLFRSLSSFMQRLIDPNEFAVLQERFFASFNAVDSRLLGAAAVMVLGASLLAWRLRRSFDVLLLGRDNATMLGVDHRRAVTGVLVVVAVMVSVSTALVGPVTFFGLLVANLAYQLSGTHRHRAVLPVAVLLAVLCLVGGQVVLERVLGYDTALSVVIEFLGGLMFLTLLLRGSRR
ncbi:iron chelate uptake ABC transporter family permease subunit [Actinotalea sp. K2]|uniref:iron chelate uptake ABC transporter family permease subunit n=1 Tax=Actinotalea sp. K2 TaxID=2939438 RepID=UPI0020181F00|nr:iron chelate uptake ABC transporter family permease subunit [Actinotalea sp. K2]MCL3861030.1 iron chelate uptake ABC transporter family permease subunit [Actinotalea sp. K2]